MKLRLKEIFLLGILMISILSSCNGQSPSPQNSDASTFQPTVSMTTVTLSPTIAPEQTNIPLPTASSTSVNIKSASCPITPVYMDFWISSAPAAGEFPVWMTSRGQSRYSQLGPIVLPMTSSKLDFTEGRFTKDLVFVDQSIEGDLTIIGRQINGDVIVYFPDEGDTVRVDEGTLQLVEVPPQEFTIRSAHKRTRSPNPSGKAHHGMALLYTNSGCYEFTLEISGISVQIVKEILDD